MLSNATISAVIPVTDLKRARQFYEGVLGLTPYQVDEQRADILYRSAGTYLNVYERQTASSGKHTIAGFDLGNDFDAAIEALLKHGITFDTFEIPGVEIPWDDRGVLTDGTRASAWFKDPDGNVLVISKGMI